jgi:SM-20-related protein
MSAVNSIAPGAFIVDDLLPEAERKAVYDYLHAGGWKFGWKSHGKTDVYSFWHKHFAGHRKLGGESREKYPCAEELALNSPFLHALWSGLQPTMFEGHTLYRCYANAFAYGSDGTIHTDSKAPNSFTAVYYPHAEWQPNWSGETVLFNNTHDDIVASVYPKPNRLLVLRGNIPHVARGVSRTCPKLRVTLMFKTEIADDPADAVPSGAGEDAPYPT